ncbi:MAG: Ig-like domain-containing protein [Gemmatimonadaceae bacterium]|nr:Ig-like domain-containing protein [Gemmatimonadaceae bacterium]
MSVSVVPETSLLAVGDTVRLVASPRDAGGLLLSGRVVTWASDATGVATVAATGVVRGVTPGLVRITATSESRTGSATISIR